MKKKPRNATGLYRAAESKFLQKARARSPLLAELHRRAEKQMREQVARHPMPRKPAKDALDTQKLLHELQVHQVELELQNAELQEARDRIEMLLETYTDLYDFAPVGYFTLDAGGVIQQVNLTGASLLGSERERMIGRNLAHWFSAERRPAFHEFLKQVFASEARHSGDFVLALPGEPAQAVHIEARRNPNEPSCRAAMVDITARKRAEETLRLSEIRYRRLFEAAHYGVILVDPATGRITDANPFVTKLLGTSREPLVGKQLFEIGLLKNQSTSRAMFRQLEQQQEVRYEDVAVKSAAGKRREIEVVAHLYEENGQAVVQCNLRDITQRKHAERAQRRSEVLAASNRKLEAEIVRRRAVEASLKKSERHQDDLLRQSRRMQEQLRWLSHQILRAQEEERKRISRELHDEVVQTLTGINVQLADLNSTAGIDRKALERKITGAQRLVEESVEKVHQFARELRPSVLDDLGLIPALHSFVKSFAERTRLRVFLRVFAGVEQLDGAKQTVIYRVVQEALTNVLRHARATRVDVHIEKVSDWVRMQIQDNGRAFSVQRTLNLSNVNRLGLLGMRERVEMVGGRFSVESARGRGTTICAQIPLRRRAPGASGAENAPVGYEGR